MPEEFFFLLLEMGLGIGYGLTPATLNRLVQKIHKSHSEQIFSHPLSPPSVFISINTYGHAGAPVQRGQQVRAHTEADR